MISTRAILKAVKDGKISVDEAQKMLKLDAIAIVDDIARLDPSRYYRRGVPEIIYGKSKSPEQIAAILSRLIKYRLDHDRFSPIIVSRISRSTFEFVRSNLWEKKEKSMLMMRVKNRKGENGREMNGGFRLNYYPDALMATVSFARRKETGGDVVEKDRGRVCLLSAGTSDIFAIKEAQIILSLMGCKVKIFNDVGVAGLHRIAGPIKEIQAFDPDAVVVAAGMEGALPSVVAGLLSVPVIGIPVSSGYGYGGDGEAALMSMLQACSLGISVVNIDSGTSAGVIAALIANRCAESRSKVRDAPFSSSSSS
jgi:NCAIR mutase (PurE)-related protein